MSQKSSAPASGSTALSLTALTPASLSSCEVPGSRDPPLHHLHRQRRRCQVKRRPRDIPRRHAHRVVRPHRCIKLDEPRRADQRRLRQIPGPDCGSSGVTFSTAGAASGSP